MNYNEILSKVSKDTGLTAHLIDRTYRAYWRAIREHICSLPLKEDLTEEEFMKLKPNVNIPSIGKLFVTFDRYQRLRTNYKSNIKKRNATHSEIKSA